MNPLLKEDFTSASSMFVKSFPSPETNAQYDFFKPQAVFFGTGLVTPQALSEGLPFDFLSLVVAAESLRRSSMNPQMAKIVHYIPDVTARQNAFADKKSIKDLADRTEIIAKKIATHFGLQDHYIVVRGSDIESNPRRHQLLELAKNYAATTDVQEEFKGYMAEQLADMAFLRETYGGSVKVSWTMARNPQAAAKGLDETFFDTHYRDFSSRNESGETDELQFAYIQPGRRLHSKVNRACPYTSVAGEPRLSLTHKFSVVSEIEAAGLKTDSDVAKDAIRYWGSIVDEMEDLFDFAELPKKPLSLTQKPTLEDVRMHRLETMQRIDAARSKMSEILSL